MTSTAIANLLPCWILGDRHRDAAGPLRIDLLAHAPGKPVQIHERASLEAKVEVWSSHAAV